MCIIIFSIFLQTEAKALNKQEVLEEDRIKHLPKNHAVKQQRLQREFDEEQEKQRMKEEVCCYFKILSYWFT